MTGAMAKAFEEIDVLLLPTTTSLPPLVGAIDGRTDAFDLTTWTTMSYGYAPYVDLFNVTGQPAISLPLGVSRDGMPIGVQFAAPLGRDAQLLTLAADFERTRPWSSRLSALQERLLY